MLLSLADPTNATLPEEFDPDRQDCWFQTVRLSLEPVSSSWFVQTVMYDHSTRYKC